MYRMLPGIIAVLLVLASGAACEVSSGTDVTGDVVEVATVDPGGADLEAVSECNCDHSEAVTPATAKLTGTTQSWDSTDQAFHDPYVTIDIPGRRVVVQPNIHDVATYGEMEITWDAPPDTLSEGQVFTIHYGGTITKTPSLNAGAGIYPGCSPTWLLDTTSGGGKQWVGLGSDGVMSQGTLDASMKVHSLAADASIYFVIDHLTISYDYKM